MHSEVGNFPSPAKRNPHGTASKLKVNQSHPASAGSSSPRVEVNSAPRKQTARKKFKKVFSPYFTPPQVEVNSAPRKQTARKKTKKVFSPYFASPHSPAPSPASTPAQPEVAYDWKTVASVGISRSVVGQHPHIPRYVPMPSPFGLVQEQLFVNPWALLVATIFLNRTKGTAARPRLYEFLTRYPTPELAAQATVADLLPILTPLGLQNIRAARLIKFSQSFVANPHFDSPTELGGIGKYGCDSWLLFCGRRGDVAWQDGSEGIQVEDKELKKYVSWRRSVG
ncbi:Methyl-CpG-binding domain protein 4 [Borealophlyctis nickersoniae]|nr:Methyl-CpG-binding domain protein 4 [Borealophlyctis nickersoniae]